MKLRFSRTDGRMDGHIGDIEALADAGRALKNYVHILGRKKEHFVKAH